MKVRDIGMKKVFCACPTATVADLAAMMRDMGVGVLPICDNDNRMLGLITDRDIVISCIAKGNDLQSCKSEDFMMKDPVTVSPDMDLEEAARVMAKTQVRRLPVVEDGKLVGMISLGDISLALKSEDNLVADTLRKISTHTPGGGKAR